ncbi:hypothetical protein GU926_15135 [Nibribacter ruber]|uniref:Uncharacterized protein n=1 Tax=Nibribacter ruber TaxID=2698458 RepID=A0A6P1P2S2_9BACT|nr:hypothetical protein [Nibribacter ruber]QHL88688.1 hypothetical protein GU926_15135 [Nibribacter ruber]
MKKLLISVKRLSWSLLVGGALMAGTVACSTGTGDGETNVEESDFKDKSPTEHNEDGMNDTKQDNRGEATPGAGTTPDSAYEDVYDRQQEKMRDRPNNVNNANGVGGAAGTTTN